MTQKNIIIGIYGAICVMIGFTIGGSRLSDGYPFKQCGDVDAIVLTEENAAQFIARCEDVVMTSRMVERFIWLFKQGQLENDEEQVEQIPRSNL